MKRKRFKIIPSSYVILIKNNKILLSRRFNTGFRDGYYGLVAGHGERAESFSKSIIREAKEEANISLIPESNATYLARSAKNAKLDFYGKL